MGKQPDWAIVTLRPSAEEVAEKALRRAGYRVYLPRYRKALWPHGAGRNPVGSLRPLWPGIAFLQDWRGWPRETITGVIRMMPNRSTSGGIARLADEDISLLMDKERRCEFDEIKYAAGAGIVVRDDIEIGEAVDVERAGVRVSARLEGLSDSGIATIRAFILGADRVWTVDQSELIAVG